MVKVPKVLAKVREVAPGADTTTCFVTFVTIVKSLAGTVVTVSAPTAALTVKDKELAFPSAVTVTGVAEVLAARPDTVVVTTPDELVVPVAVDTPNTVASVATKVTGTPANTTPLAFLTKAVKVTVLPPAVKVVPAELETVSVAPLIWIGNEAAAAAHDAQVAETVATRVVWSEELAVKVTVANPVVTSVVKEEAPKMALPEVANAKAAPLTNAFDASSARTVRVMEEVPSAFKVCGLGAEISKLEMAAETVGVGVVTGVFASPPPPPHAAKTTANTKPIVVLSIDIVYALFMS